MKAKKTSGAPVISAVNIHPTIAKEHGLQPTVTRGKLHSIDTGVAGTLSILYPTIEGQDSNNPLKIDGYKLTEEYTVNSILRKYSNDEKGTAL